MKKGDINRFPITLPGITAVQNITDFTGGYDAESDADLLERYIEKVSRPNVSGNKYHYIEWAKEVRNFLNINKYEIEDFMESIEKYITYLTQYVEISYNKA